MTNRGRLDHYCDAPMAAKKGFLPYCDGKCKSCPACIIISPDGKREHVNCGRKARTE